MGERNTTGTTNMENHLLNVPLASNRSLKKIRVKNKNLLTQPILNPPPNQAMILNSQSKIKPPFTNLKLNQMAALSSAESSKSPQNKHIKKSEFSETQSKVRKIVNMCVDPVALASSKEDKNRR